MSSFPKCPQWAKGLTYRIPINGGCILHVPMALCSTKKSVSDLAANITNFVTEQNDAIDPNFKLKALIQEKTQLEKEYEKINIRAKQIQIRYNKILIEGQNNINQPTEE